MNQPLIKYTGSKRFLAKQITSCFPSKIETYYEPFLGGGSIFLYLLKNNYNIKKYVCSDINIELIKLWEIVKNNPKQLIKYYIWYWNILNKFDSDEYRKKKYYEIKKRFNKTKNPYMFNFLTRTCFNGLIRYNKNNEFNVGIHPNRKGIKPLSFIKIVNYYHSLFAINDVTFKIMSFDKIKPLEDDFVFLDPPYLNTKGMYFGTIDAQNYIDFLRQLKCSYAFTFDGKLSDSKDMTFKFPEDIFTEYFLLDAKPSKFREYKIKVQESLYLKGTKKAVERSLFDRL